MTSLRRTMPQPYRVTAEFDAKTLPAALRREHRTKAGTWGIVRVLEGEVKLTFVEPLSEEILSPGSPGLLRPEQLHFVEPMGRMRMRVEFHTERPEGVPPSDVGLRTNNGQGSEHSDASGLVR